MASIETLTSTLPVASRVLAEAGFSLYTHQIEGIRFMVDIESKYNRGGVLADEVGLGKTIQAIGLLLEKPAHTLIACPLGVVPQWEEKLKYIMPEDRFVIIVQHGKTRINDVIEFINTQELAGKFVVMISTLGLMTRVGPIHLATWGRFILDEAHYARNPNTRLFKKCKTLKAETKWMLSATPVQNKTEDLMSLFRISCKLAGRTRKLDKIKKLRDIFLLRRTKEEINQTLPPLAISNKICRFVSEDEEQFYSKVEESTSNAFNEAIKKTDYAILMLELLMRLRQCTLHPQIVIDGYKKKGLFHNNLPEWDTKSTKIHYIEKIIKKELAESPDQRTIIFCQFHKEIELIQEMLTENGFTSEVYSGKTDQEKRIGIITGIIQPQFLLIQIRAGGAGLNLQEYNRVFITSPDWNPSNEFQAIGRSHRNGQTKPVKVTRLILHWTKKYMKKLDQLAKQAEDAKKRLKKDNTEPTLSIEERIKLKNIIELSEKQKRNTIDYRILMIQKDKTKIQADALDDEFLTKIHTYDVQEIEQSGILSASNYRYLLG